MKPNRWIELISFLVILLFIVISAIEYYPPLKQFFREIYPMIHRQAPQNPKKSKNLSDFGIYIPAHYEIHGIDISHYQFDIDWKEVANMKIDGINLQFAFMKATEGDTKEDAFFKYNWQEAKKNGLLRGAYHFYRPNINSRRQAKHFINTVQIESGDLPPVLDIEIVGRYSIENTHKGLKNWLQLIEKHYGVRPIIYTNLNFYKKHLRGHFEEYTFWIARYEVTDIGIPSSTWSFWQYSDRGKVNGIAGEVDFNAFQGDRNALKAICKP